MNSWRFKGQAVVAMLDERTVFVVVHQHDGNTTQHTIKELDSFVVTITKRR